MASNASARTSSGVQGLDELMEGGFPARRVILVAGEPGSGKTVLGIQFLVNGMQERNESGLFVCMEETKTHLYQEMRLFNWDLADLEKRGRLAFVDATPLRLLPEKVRVGEVTLDRKEFSMMTLIQAIDKEIERLNPTRVVVDPVTALVLQYRDVAARRTAMLDLVSALAVSGATTLITSELKALGRKRRLEIEEFLAHGVVVLQSLMVAGTLVRAVQIEKMRETNCDTQPHPYKITRRGIEVFPRESVFK